jgi:hypothetical protein
MHSPMRFSLPSVHRPLDDHHATVGQLFGNSIRDPHHGQKKTSERGRFHGWPLSLSHHMAKERYKLLIKAQKVKKQPKTLKKNERKPAATRVPRTKNYLSVMTQCSLRQTNWKVTCATWALNESGASILTGSWCIGHSQRKKMAPSVKYKALSQQSPAVALILLTNLRPLDVAGPECC